MAKNLEMVVEIAGVAKPSRGKRGSRPSGRTPADTAPPEPQFDAPDFGDSRRVRIGSSVIEEFVAGHDAQDILRELVQNEFDGGGDRLALTFGAHALQVSGSGRGIAPDGWDRLSVIVGTGEVMGSEEVVSPKVNGIGSKNFGLRSLFLYGDQIYVMSRGRVALLDLATKETGVARDPATASAKGVRLHVPYRVEATRRLEAFTVEREQHAFDQMAAGIPDTLVKLALGGRNPGLREVVIRSIRTHRSIRWVQKAEVERSRLPGVSVVTRSGRLSLDSGRTTSLQEIEFSRTVDLAQTYAGRDFPAYYRQPGGRVRIAVSLPLTRARVDAEREGHFYYPLKAPASRTGCAVSVSAPFELNNDRSSVNDNGWNDWLVDQATDLTFELLTTDWLKRYGPDAFRALITNGEGKPDRFSKGIARRLAEDACWPTRAKSAGRFAKASQTVLPGATELDGFLSDESYLDAALTRDAKVAELASNSGAKAFTLSSLVRMRCAGNDAKSLATKLRADEANYSFTQFKEALGGQDLQVRLAAAVSTFRRNLTKENRADLSSTASTLSATGELRPAKDLILVGRDIWDGCPEPMANRLHPALAEHRAISGYCTPFDEEKWLIGAARRAATAAEDDPEREVLYRKLLTDDGPIKRNALAALRDNPVVRNQRGAWTAPGEMVALKRPLARLLDPVMDAPSPEMLRAPGLIARLRIRDTLSGADIVQYAEALSTTREPAAAFDKLLADHLKLVNGAVVSALRKIPCLMSRSGELAAPATLHLDTAINRQCIDDRRIVGGGNALVHQRLRIRDTPDCETLLAMIAELREAGHAPLRPELLYPILVHEAVRERRPKAGLSELPICWVQGGYHAPSQILVGPRVHALFGHAIPVHRASDETGRAYVNLGAPTFPTDGHWVRLLRHVGSQWAGEPVGDQRRRTLLEAYQLRGGAGLPDGLDDVECLVDDRHRLFSVAQLRRGMLVEGDFPALQQALRQADSPVGVVARSERSRAFFVSLAMRPLSSIAGTGEPLFGPMARSPLWYQPKHRERLLAMLRRPLFVRALQEIAYGQRFNVHGFDPADLATVAERLSQIQDVAFFATIARRYSVAGVSVEVPTDVALGGGAVCLVTPRTKQQFQFLLAEAMAEVAGASNAAATRALANALLPLVLCATPEDLRAYLDRIGIEHHRHWDAQNEDEEAVEEVLEEEIVRQLFDNLDTGEREEREVEPVDGGGGVPSTSEPPPSPPPTPTPSPPTFTLPDLESVDLLVADIKGTEIDRRPTVGGGGGGGSTGVWLPRTAAEIERDQKVGHRGEALVYRQELERVRAMGHVEPERLVIWTSRADPGADHDIRSVDDKGRTKWIEVKSTTGVDGRFDWSRKEFEKALRERDRYELWRVYLAATTAPVAKCFKNPSRMVGKEQIALEIGGLRASIEGVG